MKKVILSTVLVLGAFQALQADSTVYYDKQDVKKEASKPNHPNDDIYPSK